MSGLEQFISVVKFLETYRGRDVIIRLSSYATCFFGGLAESRNNKSLSTKLLTIANEFSKCRTILRLYDDSAMMAACLRYTFAKKEGKEDPLQNLLTHIKIHAMQLFYPMEHISWAAMNDLININRGPWAIMSLFCWIVYLLAGIIQSLAGIYQSRLESDITEEQRKKRRLDLVNLLEHSCNLVLAVAYLPPQMPLWICQNLWAGQLSNTGIGVFGIASTLLSMTKM